MVRRNEKIREALAAAGLPVWYLKNIMQCSDSTVTRRMRDELPEAEQIRIAEQIREEAARIASEK